VATGRCWKYAVELFSAAAIIRPQLQLNVSEFLFYFIYYKILICIQNSE
jgi:hypothetical protein